MRITIGELFRLARRRNKLSIEEAAARINIPAERLRNIELDRSPPLGIGHEHWPQLTRLTFGEYAALGRWREGATLEDIAKQFKVSRITLIKQEHDRTSSSYDLARWWKGAYPAPKDGASTVPIQLPKGL